MTAPTPPTPSEDPILKVIRETAEQKYRRRWRVLARRLGWPLSKLSRLLSGDQSLRLVDFMALCQVLGLTASHLLQVAGA